MNILAELEKVVGPQAASLALGELIAVAKDQENAIVAAAQAEEASLASLVEAGVSQALKNAHLGPFAPIAAAVANNVISKMEAQGQSAAKALFDAGLAKLEAALASVK